MTQWILSSSLLIAAVLLIRGIGQDRLSARLRYALWGLVLLRLLIPGTVGESALSLHNWLPASGGEIVSAVPQAKETVVIMPAEEERAPIQAVTNETTVTTQTIETTQTNETTQATVPPVQHRVPVSDAPKVQSADVLRTVWLWGMAVVGAMFLVSNVRFWLRLRRSRVPAMTETVPVYESAAVETPCLFGFPRPAVYVTPAVMEDTLALRHVLTHELTHYRHGDHIWSLLRCVAVTLHWYNPLVWVAAILSQKDGELACDEGALARLGGSERTAYARTLLNLTCVGYGGLLTAATSMTGSESDLKTRIKRIVKNPKMTAAACGTVLLAAAVIGVMVFTASSDPLEGTWYGVRETEGAYPETERHIANRITFRDGRVRSMCYVNGVLEYHTDWLYTIKGDMLYLENEDYGYTKEAAVSWIDEDTLAFLGANNIMWDGELTRTQPVESALISDPLAQVRSFTDLSRNGEWAVLGYLPWLEARIVDLLQRAEILSETTMPATLTYTDYCYGMTVAEYGRETEMILCDGWLYREGKAYALSNAHELTELLWNVQWEPAGGRRDELGMGYSTYPQGAVNIEMDMPHDYREKRYYTPEHPEDWKRAWAEAAEKGVAGDYPIEELAFYVESLDNFLNVSADGVVVYHKWITDENGIGESVEHHVSLSDAPALAELMEPYLQVYRAAAAKGVNEQRIYGAWLLAESPDPRVTDISAMMNTNAPRYVTTERDVWLAATVDGCIVVTEFDIYLEDGLYHIRYKDGREEALPYTLTEDTLTLRSESGDWVFKRGTIDMGAENGDLIRFPHNAFPDMVIRLDLSDEKLGELEALLRAGMTERETKTIFSDNHYYKLPGLEEAFQTEDITLTDRGTLHFSGKAYDLTNWEAIEAYLDTLYRKKN